MEVLWLTKHFINKLCKGQQKKQIKSYSNGLDAPILVSYDIN